METRGLLGGCVLAPIAHDDGRRAEANVDGRLDLLFTLRAASFDGDARRDDSVWVVTITSAISGYGD